MPSLIFGVLGRRNSKYLKYSNPKNEIYGLKSFEIIDDECGLSSLMHDQLIMISAANLRQVYVKFSALFRVSRSPYPYEDLSDVLPKLVSSYGANRIMWGR